MLAAYWIAVDNNNKAYVYKELYQSGLIISDAAKVIKDMTNENIYHRLAPPDLWNRRQETGKSASDLFKENGVNLIKANNDRVQGWYNLKEWLKPYEDEQGVKTASLVIFNNCVNLIRTLPQVQRDAKDPNDVATEPHELTHAPDSIRYFIAGRPKPCIQQKPQPHYNFDSERPKPSTFGTVTEDFFKGGWN
jgi:phage terminase large subunit